MGWAPRWPLGLWMDRHAVGRNAMESLLGIISSKLLGSLCPAFPSSMFLLQSALGLPREGFDEYIVLFSFHRRILFVWQGTTCLPTSRRYVMLLR